MVDEIRLVCDNCDSMKEPRTSQTLANSNEKDSSVELLSEQAF